MGHAPLLQDAGHDREGGDGHRRRHEQRKRRDAPLPARILVQQRRRAETEASARAPTARPTSLRRRLPARFVGARSSAPTMNMNSTRPTCDRPSSAGRLDGSKTCACHSGNSAPNTIGPSTMPAAISPITGGWPRWRSSRLSRRAVPRITTSCSSSGECGIGAARQAAERAACRGPPAGTAAEQRQDRVASSPGDRPWRVATISRASCRSCAVVARMRAWNPASSSVSLSPRFSSANQAIRAWSSSTRRCGRRCGGPRPQEILHREIQLLLPVQLGAQLDSIVRSVSRPWKNSWHSTPQ